MSPIALADLTDSSRSESSEAPSSPHNEYRREVRPESTYPRTDGQWAIGDEKNEPVAIVGIGMQ